MFEYVLEILRKSQYYCYGEKFQIEFQAKHTKCTREMNEFSITYFYIRINRMADKEMRRNIYKVAQNKNLNGTPQYE